MPFEFPVNTLPLIVDLPLPTKIPLSELPLNVLPLTVWLPMQVRKYSRPL